MGSSADVKNGHGRSGQPLFPEWEAEALGIMAHDVRNALAPILSSVNILKLQAGNPVAEQACRTIERQAELLARLADHLEYAAHGQELQHHPAPASNAPASQAAGSAGLGILVVDDNRDAADSIAILLRLNGHQVQVAYDGPGAIALARREPPDVCLLDIGMPGMDGYALAKALRQEPRLGSAVLIAVTGFAQDGDRESTRSVGFDAHLVKPVEMATLEPLLRQKYDQAR